MFGQHKEALSPFTDVLQRANAFDLATRTLAWAHEVQDDGRSHAEILGQQVTSLSVVASVFQAVCAPTNPTPRFLDLGATLLLIFLSVDDTDPSAIPEPTPTVQWEIGQFTPTLRRWKRDFHELDSARPINQTRFITAYHDYLRARRCEPSQAHAISVNQHWASRRRTIFSEPFITQSIVTLNLDTDPFAAHVEPILDCVANTAWLANDLGSMGRDLEKPATGDDLNIITTYRRELGLSARDAFERAVREYNQTIIQLQSLIQQVRSTKTRDAASFIDIVLANVQGNLDAMRLMKFRYANIDVLFDRLMLI